MVWKEEQTLIYLQIYWQIYQEASHFIQEVLLQKPESYFLISLIPVEVVEPGYGQLIFRFYVEEIGQFMTITTSQVVKIWLEGPAQGLSNMKLSFPDPDIPPDNWIPVSNPKQGYNYFYSANPLGTTIAGDMDGVIRADVENMAGPEISLGFLEGSDLNIKRGHEDPLVEGDFPLINTVQVLGKPEIDLWLAQDTYNPGDVMRLDAEIENPETEKLGVTIRLYLVSKRVVPVKKKQVEIAPREVLLGHLLEFRIRGLNPGNYAWLAVMSDARGFLDYSLVIWTLGKSDDNFARVIQIARDFLKNF